MNPALSSQHGSVFESTDLAPPHFGFLHRVRSETDFVPCPKGSVAPEAVVREPVSVISSGLRKLRALRIMSRRESRVDFDAEEFFQRMSDCHRQLATSRSLPALALALWRAEKLSFAFFLVGDPVAELSDQRLARELRPIAHTGLGLAAPYHAGMDFERLQRYIKSFGDSDHSFFAYESLGVIMGIQPRGFFGRSMQGLARLGLVERMPADDDREALAREVTTETRRILAHGFGRSLYFKHLSFEAALRAARTTESFSTEAVLRGITAAYVMVNSSVLPRTLQLADAIQEPRLAAAVRDGLINAMAFYEWVAPGCLAGVQPQDRSHAILVRVAADEARAARDGLLPPPFALGRSPTGPGGRRPER